MDIRIVQLFSEYLQTLVARGASTSEIQEFATLFYGVMAELKNK